MKYKQQMLVYLYVFKASSSKLDLWKETYIKGNIRCYLVKRYAQVLKVRNYNLKLVQAWTKENQALPKVTAHNM